MADRRLAPQRSRGCGKSTSQRATASPRRKCRPLSPAIRAATSSSRTSSPTFAPPSARSRSKARPCSPRAIASTRIRRAGSGRRRPATTVAGTRRPRTRRGPRCSGRSTDRLARAFPRRGAERLAPERQAQRVPDAARPRGARGAAAEAHRRRTSLRPRARNGEGGGASAHRHAGPDDALAPPARLPAPTELWRGVARRRTGGAGVARRA